MSISIGFAYGAIIGFLIGAFGIIFLLWAVEENTYYYNGWRQAEIYHLRTDSLKYQYKLDIDSVYTQIREEE